MNKAFLSFNDRILSSNLLQNNSDLARELRNTTENFLTLTRSAADGSSAESADSDGENQNILSAQIAQEPPQPQIGNGQLEGSRMVDIGMGYVQILDDPVPHGQLTPPTDYADMSYSDGAIISQGPHLFQPLGVTSSDFTLFPSTTADPTASIVADTYNVQILNPTTDEQQRYSDDQSVSLFKSRTISAPYTFSVNEITFARRLQRAGFERAFHLLVKAEARPEAYRRVFRLSLPYHTRENLLKKVRHILTNSTLETLDVLHTPFIELGGAGTHYSTNRRTNSYAIKFGPNQKARLKHVETGLDPGIEFDIDMNEYEGEWFDSSDVEGYLLELGMNINPRASFAEAHVSNKSPLMELLRQNGLVNDSEEQNNNSNWTPPTSTSTTADQGITNTLSSKAMDDLEIEGRFFQEIGVSGASGGGDIGWSNNDLMNAAGWLMGSGDKTPEFSSSGWTGYQHPSSWEASDSLSETMRSLSHTPEALAESVRKITLDVSGLIDCKFPIYQICSFKSNIIRCYFSWYMPWSSTGVQEKGCGAGSCDFNN
jgi:hypothetical protein